MKNRLKPINRLANFFLAQNFFWLKNWRAGVYSPILLYIKPTFVKSRLHSIKHKAISYKLQAISYKNNGKFLVVKLTKYWNYWLVWLWSTHQIEPFTNKVKHHSTIWKRDEKKLFIGIKKQQKMVTKVVMYNLSTYH